jgi:phage gp36-like protein
MYLERADLEIYMEAEEIDQIIDSNANIIPAVISDALEFCREKLIQRYNIDAEYLLAGPARNGQLVKQSTAVALFYLSERLNTNYQAESRFNSFQNAEKWLKEVSKGERNLNIVEIDAVEKSGYPVVFGAANKTNTYL